MIPSTARIHCLAPVFEFYLNSDSPNTDRGAVFDAQRVRLQEFHAAVNAPTTKFAFIRAPSELAGLARYVTVYSGIESVFYTGQLVTYASKPEKYPLNWGSSFDARVSVMVDQFRRLREPIDDIANEPVSRQVILHFQATNIPKVSRYCGSTSL